MQGGIEASVRHGPPNKFLPHSEKVHSEEILYKQSFCELGRVPTLARISPEPREPQWPHQSQLQHAQGMV